MTKRARDVPDAIKWHEGMMLAPQHFQQMALRGEQLLVYHVAAAAPYPWGVRRFVHDEAQLAEGMLRVVELEALMPDGLLIDHGPHRSADETGPQATLLECPLAPHADTLSAGPLTVYLAVPVHHGDSADGPQRYVEVEGPLVADEAGGGEVRIPRRRPRPHLRPVPHGAPPPDSRFIAMPLVRVARRNEIFTLTGYQPPSLALTRDSPLGRACTELIGTIRQKAVKLTHRVNAPSLPSDSAVRRQMLERLDSLVAALPPFEAVVKSGVAHPFMVYLALTALVGHVTRLGAGEVPPVLEAYDHDDPQSSFEPAFAFLDRMLARIQETFTALPFHYDEGRFWIHLDPAYMAPALTIGVRAPTGWDDRDVVAWARDCLISTESGMDAVQDYRVRGAAREQIDRDTELGLDPPNGVVLFRVTADPEYVRPDRQLVIWDWHDDPGRPRPAEILLYVRTGTAKADRPAPAGQGAGT